MIKDTIKSKEYQFTTLYEPIEEGGYQVTVPSFPGLVTYGRDIQEAKEMARDAINCYIQGLLITKVKKARFESQLMKDDEEKEYVEINNINQFRKLIA